MTAAAQSAQPQNLRLAIFWIAITITSFLLMTVGARSAQAELTTFQLMLWRSLFGFVVISAIVHFRGPGLKAMWPRNIRLHGLRNVLHFTGQNLWFYGLTVLPLGQLIALEFTAPIFVVLLAPLVLAERLTKRKLFSALLGFIGVLIVARPGFQPLGLGHLAGLLAALAFAFNMLLTRKLMTFDGVLTVLFWMTLMQASFALPLSFIGGFVMPSAEVWPSILIVGITGLSAHFALTSALGHAPATIVAPMEFARLPATALMGTWLYLEPFDPLVIMGAVVIFAANWLNIAAPRRG